MEQQLINAWMKFAAKAGAGQLVRDLIVRIDQNGNPKAWTPHEIEHAVDYLQNLTDAFGKAEALTVIQTLMRKFDIQSADLPNEHSLPETSGVQGLQ